MKNIIFVYLKAHVSTSWEACRHTGVHVWIPSNALTPEPTLGSIILHPYLNLRLGWLVVHSECLHYPTESYGLSFIFFVHYFIYTLPSEDIISSSLISLYHFLHVKTIHLTSRFCYYIKKFSMFLELLNSIFCICKVCKIKCFVTLLFF